MIAGLLFAALFAAIISGSAAAFVLSGCVDGIVDQHQAITEIDRFGVLKLQDGRMVRLEGVRLPQGIPDHAPDRFAKAARVELSRMVDRQAVGFMLRSPEQDRYGRLRAQIFIGKAHVWLQRELLQHGLARADVAPSHAECASEFYAAEEDARVAKRGMWSAPEYFVRFSDRLASDIGTFQIVQGKVVSAAVRKSRAYLDFGKDWRTDFTVTNAPDDLRIFRAANVDPLNYVGKTVRVRGIIESFHGPEMAIASPASIEVLKEAKE